MITRFAGAMVFTGFVVFAVAACSENGPNIENGRKLAKEHCAACHAIGADDASAIAEAPAFRDLGKSYNVEDLAEALAEGIVTGHEDMPEVAFEPNDVEDFISYLAAVQKDR